MTIGETLWDFYQISDFDIGIWIRDIMISIKNCAGMRGEFYLLSLNPISESEFRLF